MTTNPDPTRITEALWRFWTEFDAHEATARLGGIYASKPGYHNYRNALPTPDYSRRDLAADRRGPGDKASAIDLTLSDAAMRRYTNRLDVAARACDPRLYTPAGPVLREFIGTKNSTSVYCYVLVGGVPLGVGADAGPDPGRDESHLWHIHLSIIREFCDDWPALDGVLSVLRGESLSDWEARMADLTDDDRRSIRFNDVRAHALINMLPVVPATDRDGITTPAHPNRMVEEILAQRGTLNALAERVEALGAAEAERDAALRADLAAQLGPVVAAAVREELADLPAEAIEAAVGRVVERVRVTVVAPAEA